MSALIGIDLGTTYSAVAVYDETGRPLIVHNSDGQNITPSCVTERDGVVEVGEFARRTWGAAPGRAAARFKRDMGTTKSFTINDRTFNATELSALVLKKLLQDTVAQIGPVKEAVVTIPANFGKEAREATMSAAKAAGLNVEYIINEPTAAALYYAHKGGVKLDGVYAVYDLGGGTFDVSIIDVRGKTVTVKSSNGVARLGGDDFDAALVQIAADKYREATGEEMDPEDFTKNDAEEEKKSLSKRERVTAKIGRELIDLTQDEFHEAVSPLIAQAEMLSEVTMDDAGVEPADIQGVFLAGGSTRMPLVRESVARVFQREPTATANVDEVVALGAALFCAHKSSGTTDGPPGDVIEIANKCFGTLTLVSDSPMSQPELQNAVLIKKGDRLPCSVSEAFYTVTDDQTQVRCTVTESDLPETMKELVKISWEGELELPAGRPAGQEILVSFAYDVNQVMHVSFVDTQTGRKTEKDIRNVQTAADSSVIDQFMVE